MPYVYICLPAEVVAALPEILRAAGLEKAAESVEEDQAATRAVSDQDRLRYVEAARAIYVNEGDDHRTEIDDTATVSHSEDGAYVMGWCWVSKEDAGIENPDDERPATG